MVGIGIDVALGSAVNAAATAAPTVASISGTGVTAVGTRVLVGLAVSLGCTVGAAAPPAHTVVSMSGVGGLLQALTSANDSIKTGASCLNVQYVFSLRDNKTKYSYFINFTIVRPFVPYEHPTFALRPLQGPEIERGLG